MPRSRTRQAPAFLIALAALAVVVLGGAAAATAEPSIADKRAQAEAIVEQIRAMDSDLARAIESYNYANIELDRIDGDLNANGRHLVVAQKSLKIAQRRISHRLRSLYINGGSGGAVEVILGAQSLDDLLVRLDSAQAVGVQDAQVLLDMKRFRTEVKTRRERLTDARARQADVVANRAATRASIEQRLAERARLLDSVKDEIAEMQAAEAARQRQIEAQARARLAAQQSAAQVSRATVETSTPSTTAGADAAPPATAAAPPPAKYGGVVAIAMQYLGVPYVWGGMSPSGFDCSGLTAYVYAQVGVTLPHHAASQFNYGVPVSRDQLEPGDLVFFDGLGHMGMSIGGDQFIHAPHTGDVVKISSLNDSWYASKFVGARRIL